MNHDQLRQAERAYLRDFPSPVSRRERELAFEAECAGPSVPVPDSDSCERCPRPRVKNEALCEACLIDRQGVGHRAAGLHFATEQEFQTSLKKYGFW